MKNVLVITLLYLALFATSIAAFACGDQMPTINPAIDVITTVADDATPTKTKVIGVLDDSNTTILLTSTKCGDMLIAARIDVSGGTITEMGCWSMTAKGVIYIGWIKEDDVRTVTVHDIKDVKQP